MPGINKTDAGMENVGSGQASVRVRHGWRKGAFHRGTGIAKSRRQEQAGVLELSCAAGAKTVRARWARAGERGAGWSYGAF